MKRIRLAINGFGRIGRIFFRQAFGHPGLDIVAVNDLGECANLAYLLQHDTVYRQFGQRVAADEPDGSALIVGDTRIEFLQERDPSKLPWKRLAVDVVVESSGAFEEYERAAGHIAAGAKRVVISAPAKGLEGEGGRTVLVGVNEQDLRTCSVSSNASCTTNAASPVVAVLMENPGIRKAILSTVHGYTASQKLVDAPAAGDWRRGRAAAANIVPSTTGAAVAVTRALPALEGLFDGIAIRVPVVTGSLVDLTFLASRKTSVEEVNRILRDAAEQPRWSSVLEITEEPLVSSDIVANPHAAIVDLSLTKVIDGDLVKVLTWYDNEWGYAQTLVQHVLRAGELL